MNLQNISENFRTLLQLENPPVALARVSQVPEGVPWFTDVVPSSCTFWRRAEKGVFATRAQDHMNCPIGGMVMGLPLTPEAEKALKEGISLMCQVNYIDAKEAAHIPALSPLNLPILYGPLGQFPVEPELVLLWVTPAQAMLLREATGEAHWTGDLPKGVFGRPACTALAVAAKGKQAALSFGCTGMREFTEISPAHLLAVVAGEMLPDLEKKLNTVHESNCRMKEFYEGRKKSVSLQPKLPSEG
jgi:uncharacterized protein (DUF169 family)